MSGIFAGGLLLLLLELELAMVVFLAACLAFLFKAWAALLFMHEVYLLERLIPVSESQECLSGGRDPEA
jgi:hypothetical protein